MKTWTARNPITLGACLAAYYGNAAAQKPAAAENRAAQASDIVVTSRKRTGTAQDIPGSIRSMSGDELELTWQH
jgi:hypothetical protein